jgi:hypothetical protein
MGHLSSNGRWFCPLAALIFVCLAGCASAAPPYRVVDELGEEGAMANVAWRPPIRLLAIDERVAGHAQASSLLQRLADQ